MKKALIILVGLILLLVSGCEGYYGYSGYPPTDYGSDYHYPTTYGPSYYNMLGEIIRDGLSVDGKNPSQWWVDYYQSQQDFKRNYDRMKFDESIYRGDIGQYQRDYYNITPINPFGNPFDY